MVLITRYRTKSETKKEIVQALQKSEKQLDFNFFREPVKLEDYKTTLVQVEESETRQVTDFNQTITQELTHQGLVDLMSTRKVPKLNESIAYLRTENPLYEEEDLHSQYSIFKIRKSSGGFRTIKAPNPMLKELQRQHKFYLEDVLSVLPHNAAYAYIKGRSVKNAIEVHQENESKWFLKLDLKNFFDNCTKEFVLSQLRNLHPFALWTEEEFNTYAELLNIAFLDNGLPQGTPLSPTLTNLIMVEFDKWMTDYAYNHALRYTRYADDLLISSKYNFDFKIVQDDIVKFFNEKGYPFNINLDKTRYGSSSGSNWNLGLMLNKENDITIGHKNHKNIKREIFFFMKNAYNEDKYSYDKLLKMQGNLEWLRANEPETHEQLITWYKRKHNFDVYKLLTERIKTYF